MSAESSAAAPRWALCSDCRFDGLPTCATEPTCWHPIRTADLPFEQPDHRLHDALCATTYGEMCDGPWPDDKGRSGVTS